jgi:hypothetical protein
LEGGVISRGRCEMEEQMIPYACGFSSSEIGFSTNETDERSSITATKLEQMKTIQYDIIQ